MESPADHSKTRILAGIDEAGYGPRLGPLVVGCAVFRAPAVTDDEPADLWDLLSPTVVRAPGKSDASRIPIDDSKRLKLANTSPRPLQHLERGVLPCLSLLDRKPETDSQLLDALGVGCEDPPAGPGPASTSLNADQVGILSNALSRALRAADVELLGLTCVVFDAQQFNSALRELGPKSEVSFSAVGRFLHGVWRRWGEEAPIVAIDRQGGRKHYGGPLARAIPQVIVTTRQESDDRSVYEVAPVGAYRDTRNRRMQVRFEVGGDDRHLPIALASMAAKLVRERLMMRFNAHWSERAPRVKPTAGYGVDARRWIEEIKPLVSEDELRTLVRRA